MRKRRNTNSFKVLIGLFAIIIVLAPFSFANTNNLTLDEMNDILVGENGTTVFSGDDVIDDGAVKSYPAVINLGYLEDKITTGHYMNFLYSICTGVASMPASEIVHGAVDNNGRAANFDGPGYVSIDNGTINVHKPEGAVWGYIIPYTQAVKTEDGIDIVNNITGEVLGHVSAGQISESTVESDHNISQLKAWYDSASVGSKYILQRSVGGFNDGRSYISSDTLKELGGAYNYTICHPQGDSVVVYLPNDTQAVELASAVTSLGSHPQYNDANRALNARQFVLAWNNTIIPAHSQGCGREDVAFSSVPEPEAESGTATHGVCPPARVLRSVALSIGAPLPVGMTTGENAVLFGYSPSTGIFVSNPLDYPIRITMWTEGSGTGMAIYAAVEELVPSNITVNGSGSSDPVQVATVAG